MSVSEQILKQIDYLLDKANYALKHQEYDADGGSSVKSSLYHEWVTSSQLLLQKKSLETYLDKFIAITKSPLYHDYAIESGLGVINALKQDILNGFIDLEGINDQSTGLGILDYIFDNFHKAVRQMRSRYNSRTTIDVKDEYDVQDFLHAILKLFFNDIRPEEYTPSYAGSSSRMDFLLKLEKTVIEVKKTRNNLRDKEIGNELIEDIARYKSHGDCKTLICFVYDPEGLISNPAGLSGDLSRKENGFEVRVVIEP
jgi:hypothetical protein